MTDHAPEAPNPALELGFTLEAKHPREARKVYEQILARDPTSRPAILGLARVARSQNRLDEARKLYGRLLTVNPKDPEALNGMAWVALAERNREQAQAGFEHVLSFAPDNEEATAGLSMAPDVYRYLLDTSTTYVSTAQGSSWGFGRVVGAGVVDDADSPRPGRVVDPHQRIDAGAQHIGFVPGRQHEHHARRVVGAFRVVVPDAVQAHDRELGERHQSGHHAQHHEYQAESREQLDHAGL